MCGSVPRVTATDLPLRSAGDLNGVSARQTSAVHSGRENTPTVLIGLPLMRPISAAAPAVEPISIEPALRNSSALFEPSVCTQRMPTPSAASAFSTRPFSLRTSESGLYVAKSRRISLGAAFAPPPIARPAAATVDCRNERRLRDIRRPLHASVL